MENQRLWDYSSTETVDDQRNRLVKEYMQLDEIPKEWDTAQFTEYPATRPDPHSRRGGDNPAPMAVQRHAQESMASLGWGKFPSPRHAADILRERVSGR